ncbi:VOC family protein [Williamsia muralis]|uniref:VOC family protein n=1 Tax=Williamsia marianensis TaxID=85044 RepID=A0ABU4EPU6_WILMA|nr:VOC family protein [Williamsia muralis]MDV7133260.1 VOC family protein [Williamsia muralis]
MSLEVLGISFDAQNAAALAGFWSRVLARDLGDDATEEFASIAPSRGDGGPLLMFRRVPEGKTVKNRVHFDLKADDVQAETRRLIALGARELRSFGENNNQWVSFADPEGNEFDLVPA